MARYRWQSQGNDGSIQGGKKEREAKGDNCQPAAFVTHRYSSSWFMSRRAAPPPGQSSPSVLRKPEGRRTRSARATQGDVQPPAPYRVVFLEWAALLPGEQDQFHCR